MKRKKDMIIKPLINKIRAFLSILKHRNFILITIGNKIDTISLQRRTDYTDESDLYILRTVLEEFEKQLKGKGNE
jgi:rRNA-processing protein FCF1